jgi:two-component sensor histidine kinase
LHKLSTAIARFPRGGNLILFPQREPARTSKNVEKNVDLGSVLIELIEHCRRHVAPGLTISLNAKLGAGTSITLRELATLEFVVCEIVSNAYRYSHPAGTSVEVTIECNVDRTGEILIDIGDNGVGLPPDFAEWRDAGNGMVSVRNELQKIDAAVTVTSDDLGLRFQIILHPRRQRTTPARGNFVWL